MAKFVYSVPAKLNQKRCERGLFTRNINFKRPILEYYELNFSDLMIEAKFIYYCIT